MHPSVGRMRTNSSSSSSKNDDETDGGFAEYANLGGGRGREHHLSTTTTMEWAAKIRSWHAPQKAAEMTAAEPPAKGRKRRCKSRPATPSIINSNNNSQTPSSLPLKPSMGPFHPKNKNDDDNDASDASRVTRKKRKSSTSSELASSPSVSSEADSCSLRYLWERHGGQQAQAALTLLADWTREKACRTVKQRKRAAAVKRKMTGGNESGDAGRTRSQLTLNWREIVLQWNAVAVSGDYRSSNDTAAPLLLERDTTAAPLTPTTTTTEWYGSDEDLQSTWEAVLACAQAAVDGDTLTSLYLSAVAHFLQQAAQLPPPETVCATSVAGELATAMQKLVDVYLLARRHQNKLLDLWGRNGVDLDTMEKQIATTEEIVAVRLDEMAEMKRQIRVVSEWQSRLEVVYGQCTTSDEPNDRNDLVAFESMLHEGHGHGFRGKELVALEQKVERAYALRDRILEWKSSGSQQQQLETTKFVSSTVRDIHRLKMRFPEANEMLAFNTATESWVERANIAIRSRISLDEIQTLLSRGREMPLDLSEYTEKLQSRVAQATEWLESFHETIPRPERADGSLEKLELVRRIRVALEDGMYNLLHELATDGSRIPVEVDCVKLLQVELDARMWTSKAKKWIPCDAEDDGESSKRGKLEDLREHVSKAAALRDRLAMSADEKKAWVLDGEDEISAIVDAADDWLDENNWILVGDDRDDEDCLSVEQLREIAQKGNAIYANLGNGTMAKINRLLAQAEKWLEDYTALLVRCNFRGAAPRNVGVEIPELKAAIDAASDDIALDLKEAVELRNLVKRIEGWFMRASIATGEKRQTRGKKTVFTIADLHKLIEEASTLPVETTDYVARLQEQGRLVEEWQARASTELDGILVGFRYLHEAINETYGPPSEYSRARSSDIQDDDDDDDTKENIDGEFDSDKSELSDCEEEKKANEDQCDATVSTATSEQDLNALAHLGSGDCNVQALIKKFCNDSKIACIVTPERETADHLETVSRWCMRSLKYLENPRDVFDQRFFGAFDRFIAEGTALINEGEASTETEAYSQANSGLLTSLQSEWSGIVSDQLERLRLLLADRKQYTAWCKRADQLLAAEDRRPTLEKLNELAEKSREFPSRSDLVQRVRKLSKDATKWSKLASQALASDEKMTVHEGKSLFDKGDKLGFTCPEMKVFRSALKNARGWSTRVKRCKLDQGAAHHQNVVSLLEEHNGLIFDMGDEVAQLNQAMKNYCLCRRPYEGFMIGCDSCDDWFHGPCVGVSESRADKVTKYVCLRCSIRKTYTSSSMAAIGVIRKWTSLKDKKQARHNDNQKFKRKIRKEKKEIEKLQEEAAGLRNMLEHSPQTETCGHSTSTGESVASTSAAASDPSCESKPNTNVDDANGTAAIQPAAPNCEPTAHSEACKPMVLPAPPTTTMALDAKQPGTVGSNNGSSLQVAPPAVGGGTPPASEKDLGDGIRESADVNSVPTEKPQQATSGSTSGNVEGGLNLSRKEIQANLDGLARLIQGCVSRLTDIVEEEKDQKKSERVEDLQSQVLRNWVVRVRSTVVAPSSRELAVGSKPNPDGSVSDAMKSVLKDAKLLGLQDFADVKAMDNHFRCMAWCLRALSILARQPTSDELISLVKQTKSIDFPDEKAVRTLKSMAKRVTVWQNKVTKALSPIPGETKFFHVPTLKELASAGDDIPVCMPLETRLSNVIEDGGARYCLCGGPSDGRFMVGCEQCDGWFHGHCVSIDKGTPEEELNGWKCPKCAGKPTQALELNRFHENFGAEIVDESESEEMEDVSSKAPDPDELWPPFGLFGSPKANEILGEECCAIPDSLAPIAAPQPAKASCAPVAGLSAVSGKPADYFSVRAPPASSLQETSAVAHASIVSSASTRVSSQETAATAEDMEAMEASSSETEECVIAVPSMPEASKILLGARRCPGTARAPEQLSGSTVLRAEYTNSAQSEKEPQSCALDFRIPQTGAAKAANGSQMVAPSLPSRPSSSPEFQDALFQVDGVYRRTNQLASHPTTMTTTTMTATQTVSDPMDTSN